MSADYKNIKQEIEALKSIHHPNVISYYGLYESTTSINILMELCEEGTLEDLIVKRHRLQESLAQIIFKQIIVALNFCHEKGFAHRDLKPSNILISDLPSIRLSDFGVSGSISGNGLMSTICGTVYYTAPECASGHYNGQQADMWSCGVVLYVMITGKLPWDSKMQGDLRMKMEKGVDEVPGISDECNQLIKMLLNIDPDQRPTARDVLTGPWLSTSPDKLLSKNYQLQKPKTTSSILRQMVDSGRKGSHEGTRNKAKLSMSFELL